MHNPFMSEDAREAALDGRPVSGRVLSDADLVSALAVCALDPVASVLATSRIEGAVRDGLQRSGGQLWGYEDGSELLAVCWAGVNLVPVVPGREPAALDAFAALGRTRGRRCSSIVGETWAVLGLWERLAPMWPRPREVRADQPSYVIDHDPLIQPDPLVRRSVPDDYELVLPACVRMFVEEVGYSPVSGFDGAYEVRVRSLIAQRRSFVRVAAAQGVTGGPPVVVFKAELGAIAGGVAQVQGVWIDPSYRGRRYSETGMAAVVVAARRDVAPVVSLYANHYNSAALAAYRAVGFRQVGTYATVLF